MASDTRTAATPTRLASPKTCRKASKISPTVANASTQRRRRPDEVVGPDRRPTCARRRETRSSRLALTRRRRGGSRKLPHTRDLVTLGVRIALEEFKRRRRRDIPEVQPDDLALARLDLVLPPVVPSVIWRRCNRSSIAPSMPPRSSIIRIQCRALLGELVGQPLDLLRAAERIHRPADPGLVVEDLLRGIRQGGRLARRASQAPRRSRARASRPHRRAWPPGRASSCARCCSAAAARSAGCPP